MQQQYKFGDRVYLYQNRGRFNPSTHYTTGNVHKVTPTVGQMVVMLASGEEIRLNKHGYQIGSNSISPWRLDTCMTFEERVAYIEREQRCRAANHAMVDIASRVQRGNRWDKDKLRAELARLQQCIAEARLLVEAI